MALHVEVDGHTYNDPDNDTISDSYGNKKTPSTVMVLGAYVKKRRDTFIDARRYMKHEAR